MSQTRRAPEPTEGDLARAAKAKAREVFNGSDGALTVAYYRRLCAEGPNGVIAMNLFRASKTSARAKQYRGRQFRNASYDTKNYSLVQLCTALINQRVYDWGWHRDDKTVGYPWVLYIDLPCGQASFHSSERLNGPDYHKPWRPGKGSDANVLAFCDIISGEDEYGQEIAPSGLAEDEAPCWQVPAVRTQEQEREDPLRPVQGDSPPKIS